MILMILSSCSSGRLCRARWVCPFLFILLFSIFSATSISSKTTTPSYSDHCDSIVPESAPSTSVHPYFRFLQLVTGYYTGGDRILGKSSPESFSNYGTHVSFSYTGKVYETNATGTYKFDAYLIFHYSNIHYVARNSTHGRKYRASSLSFFLSGFWSESSGKLCMVGSSSPWYSSDGKALYLDAVLKLNYAKNLTIVTSLVSGTLESLSSPGKSTYFEPISILGYPFSMYPYKYTLVSQDFEVGCPGGIDVPQSLSLSLPLRRVCSMMSPQTSNFELKYPKDCNSSKNCTPFDRDVEYLPRAMSMQAIHCSDDGQRLLYLLKFRNTSFIGYQKPLDLSTMLIGEGSWDGKKNRLCIVACRIQRATGAYGEARVGDCSIRLSLRYPAYWSVRDRSSIVGQIWSNNTLSDSGYIPRITFQSSDNNVKGVPGLKYEYTEIDRVRRSCPAKKPAKQKGSTYPTGHSSDMKFDMSVKDSRGKFAWGYAEPIFVGDQIFDPYYFPSLASTPGILTKESNATKATTRYTGPLSVSYKISFTPFSGINLNDRISWSNSSLNRNGQLGISSEGIYDAETGQLCMVGCRKLSSYSDTNDSLDCEILVNFQFSPLNAKNGGLIKGSIKSTRKKSDPLYFKQFDMSSTGSSVIEAKKTIWRMDLEITMVLISNTLACVFVGLQLFHVKSQTQVLPSISLIMLVILTLGQMIPLLLNFEAVFLQKHKQSSQNVLLGTGGWVEVNEVIVRVVTMAAFLLQFRLLQLAWSARMEDGNKAWWAAEKKALLFVSLPLLTAGVLILLLVNWRMSTYSATTRALHYPKHSLWGDLKSYGGLVLDGFLLPQIIFNLFHVSKEKALSHSFYIGTTFVRLLPHAYDLYRIHNFMRRHFIGSYIYAVPTADFYSAAWDVIISTGGVLFAIIICLQQRFGGRCFLPQRFREFEVYEKVAVVSNESNE